MGSGWWLRSVAATGPTLGLFVWSTGKGKEGLGRRGREERGTREGVGERSGGHRVKNGGKNETYGLQKIAGYLDYNGIKR